MLGPLGVRVNQWTRQNGEFSMNSPFRHEFVWKERVVWAYCHNNCPKLKDTYPGSVFEEVPDAVDIREFHSCGMYAARNFHLAYRYREDYSSAVYCLVEGLGTVWVHSDGFRASGLQVVKVIDVQDTTHKSIKQGTLPWITMHATAKEYGVGIVTWAEAQACIELLYEQYLQKFEEERLANENPELQPTT